MIKKNRKKLLISSIIILLPTVIGLILWNKLPDKIPVHFGIDGKVDGWAEKTSAVFEIPLIILATHWITVVITNFDAKNKNQTPKALNLIFWIMPCISVFSMTIVYRAAFGVDKLDIFPFLFVFMGLLFAVIGNYLPKCRQNRTLGIRIKWTLQNEENWNATHRFGGKVWFVGGLLITVVALIPYDFSMFIALGILVGIAVIPCIYSYVYHRRQLKKRN